ncbi:MAG: cystathionine gamma-synthase family protein [Fimbriimonadia bacterium]|nr:cystathionine gamma-synthase family protein [Fimbriimonadia bacterium]
MRQRKSEGYIDGKPLQPESLMMGYGYQPEWSEGAVKCPIFQTSTFVFKSAEEGKAYFELACGLREQAPNEKLGLIYSRLNNPDLEILEDRLALWDDAESCAAFESGMAAISTTLLAYLRPGDYLLHNEPLYGGSDHFFKHILTQFGITPVAFSAGMSNEAIRQLARQSIPQGKLGMLYLETPANPTNALVDIEFCSQLARELSSTDRKAPVVVDNTFLGPLYQHPLKHGADLVIYSATKYIGGHSDVIAGACLGSHEWLHPVKVLRVYMGAIAGPWTGWLLLRSLETLKLRMDCQNRNARFVADFLCDHPQVEKVYYLGHLTESDPQYEIYRKQCDAPGGMISFEVKGGEREAFRFLNALKLIKLAVSLGSTESLAEHPHTMTHASMCPEDKQQFGITENMIRLSVGVEHPEDLITDLNQALEKCQSAVELVGAAP